MGLSKEDIDSIWEHVQTRKYPLGPREDVEACIKTVVLTFGLTDVNQIKEVLMSIVC